MLSCYINKVLQKIYFIATQNKAKPKISFRFSFAESLCAQLSLQGFSRRILNKHFPFQTMHLIPMSLTSLNSCSVQDLFSRRHCWNIKDQFKLINKLQSIHSLCLVTVRNMKKIQTPVLLKVEKIHNICDKQNRNRTVCFIVHSVWERGTYVQIGYKANF